MSTLQTHPAEIWDSVLESLKSQMTKPNFDTWLVHTTGLQVTDRTFTIGTPNAFVAEMLEQRMYSMIAQEVEGVLGRETEIEFAVTSAWEELQDGTPSDVNALDSDPQERTEPSRSTIARARSEANLQIDTTFDTMVVGSCNEYGYALAVAVSDQPANYENPLVIYGAVGMGKTHLMQAIGHRYVERQLRVMYQTTTEFTSDFTRAIRQRETDAWRDRYKEYDAVLIDDVQDLVGKEQTQVAFFEVYTQSVNSGVQLILALDRAPTLIPPGALEDRVRSRLNGGAVVGLDPPDQETRIAYIERVLEEHDAKMPEESVQYIARNIISNFRDLRQACLRILRRLILSGRPRAYENYLTLDQIKTVVPPLEESTHYTRTPQDVVTAVAAHYGLSAGDIKKPGRRRMISEARQVTMFILHEDLSMTYRHIADFLSLKTHGTVIRQCRTIADVPADAPIQGVLAAIRRQISGQ